MSPIVDCDVQIKGMVSSDYARGCAVSLQLPNGWSKLGLMAGSDTDAPKVTYPRATDRSMMEMVPNGTLCDTESRKEWKTLPGKAREESIHLWPHKMLHLCSSSCTCMSEVITILGSPSYVMTPAHDGFDQIK